MSAALYRCKCGDPACDLWRGDEVCPSCSEVLRRIMADPDFEGRAGDMGEDHYADCVHGAVRVEPARLPAAGDRPTPCPHCGASPCIRRFLACSIPEWPGVLDGLERMFAGEDARAAAPPAAQPTPEDRT